MTDELRTQVAFALGSIEPSRVLLENLLVYPCSARLLDGTIVDRVYFANQRTFRRLWGKEHPEPGRGVSAEEVAEVRESPFRLPVQFANEIYRVGETSFGVTAFTLVFYGWYKRNYAVAGTMVDFLDYPFWLGPTDVTGVLLYPQKWRLRPNPLAHWCVFREGGPTATES